MIRAGFNSSILGTGQAGFNIQTVVLPNRDELIFYSKGRVGFIGTSSYLTSRFPSGANHTVAQEKGVSVLFDGTGFGTLIDPDTSADTSVTLVGDFEITDYFMVSSLLIEHGFWDADPSVDGLKLTTSGVIRIGIDSVFQNFPSIVVAAGTVYKKTLVRSGTTITATLVNLATEAVQTGQLTVALADVVITRIGRHLTAEFLGNLHSLKATDSTGVKLNLQMMCGTSTVHPTVELSATPGLPNCEWSSFAAGIYEEPTDGSGFDINVLGWTVADGTTMYQEASHTNLLLVDSRIPPGAGFDASGDPLVTDNQGPISPDMKVVGIPCLLGDGTGHALITGLLTSDVITVPAGSSQPTNTINGRMDFVNAEKPYSITVTRSSVVWAFYPCEAGEGTLLEDIIGGNNGTLTSFVGDPWSTRDIGRCTHVENGFSIDHNGAGTGISCANDTFLHQDSTAPTYPRNTFANALNAEVLLEGAKGPKTQSVALWTAEAQVDLSTLPANTADQTLVGDDGMVIYDTAQSAGDIAKAVKVIGELT